MSVTSRSGGPFPRRKLWQEAATPVLLACSSARDLCLSTDKGDLDGAIREYREALRLNPNSTTLQDTLNDALKKSH